MYNPYYARSVEIDKELKRREIELATISSTYTVISVRDRKDVKRGGILFNNLQAIYINRDGPNSTYYIDEYGDQNPANIITKNWEIEGTLYTRTRSIQDDILDCRDITKNDLNFIKFIGNALLPEFLSFRRDDKYTNSNFISDGFTNDQIFESAQRYLRIARNEIYKSAEKQHTISASLKDLLIIDKFKPLREYFELGNWLRIRVCDDVYKLRLIKYELDYDSLANINVDFSDVLKTQDGISDQQSVIQQAQSMASSYSTTQRQSSEGSKGYSRLSDWVANGLDVTNQKIVAGASNQVQSWDEHGMLFQKYYDEQETYSPEQLKILNSSLVFTDDNWETIKTAVGKFYYKDPDDPIGEYKSAYGVCGEVLVGDLIIGQRLNIHNDNNTMRFDSEGFSIVNEKTTSSYKYRTEVIVDPNPDSDYAFKIESKVKGKYQPDTSYITNSYFRVSSSGSLSLSGEISNENLLISSNGSIITRDSNGDIAFQLTSYGYLEASNAFLRGNFTSSNDRTEFRIEDGNIYVWNKKSDGSFELASSLYFASQFNNIPGNLMKLDSTHIALDGKIHTRRASEKSSGASFTIAMDGGTALATESWRTAPISVSRTKLTYISKIEDNGDGTITWWTTERDFLDVINWTWREVRNGIIN